MKLKLIMASMVMAVTMAATGSALAEVPLDFSLDVTDVAILAESGLTPGQVGAPGDDAISAK